MAGRRGAPMGNKNAQGPHDRWGGRTGALSTAVFGPIGSFATGAMMGASKASNRTVRRHNKAAFMTGAGFGGIGGAIFGAAGGAIKGASKSMWNVKKNTKKGGIIGGAIGGLTGAATGGLLHGTAAKAGSMLGRTISGRSWSLKDKKTKRR